MAADDVTPTKNRQIFVSKCANQRLVREGIVQEPTTLGTLRTFSPGLTYEFDGNYLIVDDALRKRDASFFKRYGEKLEDPDSRPAQEWLRDHRLLNTDFTELELAAPDSGPLLQKIAACAIASDVESLVVIHEAEEAEWGRPEVLEAASEALRLLEERDAEPAKA